LELNDNIGDKTNTATEGDTDGNLIAKIRGLAKNLGKVDDAALVNGTIAAILRYIATVSGTTVDAAVEGDVAGTISAKLRGLLKTLGVIGDAASATGSQSAQLRYISEAINACKTALEIIDDWDESDRAKVNLIAGQAGIVGNSGNKTDNTPRVVIATDDIPTALVNTNLGVINTSLGTINTSLGTINTSLGTINTSLGTIDTNITAVNTNLGTIITALGTINTSLGTINTSLGTINTSIGTTNTNIGAINSPATEGDTDGDLIGKIRGLAKNLGKINDASLINGSIMAILRLLGDYLTTIDGDTSALYACINTVLSVLNVNISNPSNIAENGSGEILLSAVAGSTTSSYRTPIANGYGLYIVDVMVVASGAGTVVVNILNRHSSSQTTPNTYLTASLVFAGAGTQSVSFEVKGVREYAVQIVDAGAIATSTAWPTERGNA
jgi:hypothetical protein